MLPPQPLSPETVQELERLAAGGGPEAAAAREQLERLGEDRELPRELRRMARLALFRLRSRGVTDTAARKPRPFPAVGGRRIAEGVGGPILGDGRAWIAVVVEASAGGTVYVRVAVDDRRGVAGLAVEELPRRTAREELEAARQAAGVRLAPEEAAAMLGGAVATARATGSGLPVAYFAHRDLLEALLGHSPDGPFGWARSAWETELGLAGQHDQTLVAWARASGSLAEHPELGGWALPAEVMRAHVGELQRLSESRVAVLPGTVRSQLDQHILAATRELCGPPWAALLAGRFAYTALRLARLGQAQQARLAAACCVALSQPQRFAPPGALEALARRELAPIVADRLPRSAGGEGRPAERASRSSASGRRTLSGLVLP